jgi:hypothetical protein
MFKLEVSRQSDYVVARTQDYRMVLTISEVDDPASSSSSSGDFESIYPPDINLFRVYKEECGVEHFDGVVEPREFLDLGTTPIVGAYRTNTVDLYWQSDLLADAGLEAIVADIRQLLEMSYGGTVSVSLNGASV